MREREREGENEAHKKGEEREREIEKTATQSQFTHALRVQYCGVGFETLLIFPVTVQFYQGTFFRVAQLAEKLRFPSILQYKFKMRFWFDLNMYWKIEFLDAVDFGGVAFSIEIVTVFRDPRIVRD